MTDRTESDHSGAAKGYLFHTSTMSWAREAHTARRTYALETGGTSGLIWASALNDGVVCYLRKPVDEKHLMKHLMRCLRAALHSDEPPEENS